MAARSVARGQRGGALAHTLSGRSASSASSSSSLCALRSTAHGVAWAGTRPHRLFSASSEEARQEPAAAGGPPLTTAAAPRRPLRVLISGASIGGLTLAHCLKLRGIHADVIDAEGNLDRFLGRSAVIFGDALRMMQGIGVRAALEREGATLDKFVTGLSTGTTFHQQHFQSSGESGASAFALPASALAELLAESWESRSSRIQRSTSILAIRDIEGTGVRCSFNNPKLGTRDYDLIVLADSVSSGNTPNVLKEEIYLDPYLTTTQVCAYGVWSAYLPRPFTISPGVAVDVWYLNSFADKGPDRGGDGGDAYMNPMAARGLGNRAGYIPMPEDLLYFWGVHRADMAPFLKGGMRDARDMPTIAGFDKAFNMRTVVQQLDQSERVCWVHYPRDMRVNQWIHRKGRVVLLGSGAYSHAPLPLHEAVLPIQDAAVLAYSLAAYPSLGDGLTHYARSRMPQVQAAQDWAWRTHNQASKTGRWQLALRKLWLSAPPGRLAYDRRHRSAFSQPLH